ncbi:MAG: hypothetical protein WDO68_16545 [Gammaproteobacteria bacterium]
MSITKRGLDKPITRSLSVEETLVKCSGRVAPIDRVIPDIGVEIEVIINLLRPRNRTDASDEQA